MSDDEYEYDFEEEFLWVEDGEDIADELVGMTAPDPPNHAAFDEWDEHTRFEYFNDIEYDSDGYNDESGRKPKNNRKKRKRNGGRRAGHVTINGIKIMLTPQAQLTSYPPVLLWETPLEGVQDYNHHNAIKSPGDLSPYALPGWRFYLEEEEVAALDATHLDSYVEKDTSGRETDGDSINIPPELTTDYLKRALTENLAALGIAGNIDEDLLLTLATSMANQDDGAEEMLARLIEDVHGRGKGDELDPFSSWVASSATTSVNARKRGRCETEAAAEVGSDRVLKRRKNLRGEEETSS